VIRSVGNLRSCLLALRGVVLGNRHFTGRRIEVTASHASMVSQPEAVTRLILSAVEETSRSKS
jgi:hypothetical protein